MPSVPRTGTAAAARWALALMIGLGVAALQVAISRGVFVYGDDILMFEVARSIAEGRGLEVESPSDRGNVARSIPGVDGRRYAKYGLGLSLVAAPFTSLGDREPIRSLELPETVDAEGNPRAGARVFAAGLANAAIAGALAAVLFLLALELDYGAGAALTTALLSSLASPIPHYAAGFLSEPLSALCLTAGVLGLAKSEESRGSGSDVDRSTGRIGGAPAGWMWLGGLAVGFALLTRLLHLLFLVPLAFGMLSSARNARLDRTSPQASRWLPTLLWAFPVAVASIVIGVANFVRFGSVWETGYGAEASSFGTPLLEGLTGQLVSPGKGVLWFCPAILLGLAGAFGFWRRSPRVAATILAGSTLLLLTTSKYYQWHGGGCWGPRFLVPLLPLWLLPAAEVFSRWRGASAARRASVVAVVAISLASAALPILVPFDRIIGEVRLEPERLASSFWTWRESPLLKAASEIPKAMTQTADKLAGRVGLEPTHVEPDLLHSPDFAFTRYGSHALLQWSRFSLLTALLAGAGMARIISRS